MIHSMKEINGKKSYTLLILIVASTLLFSILGSYWNQRYYHNENTYPPSTPPLALACAESTINSI